MVRRTRKRRGSGRKKIKITRGRKATLKKRRKTYRKRVKANASGCRKKGPAAYDKKKEVHVPGHEDDDEKVKGKNGKTDTGKKAAKVDTKPEITEKKKSIKSGYKY